MLTTLTAITLTLIVLVLATNSARSRSQFAAADAKIRTMARERGLDETDIRQLDALSRLLAESSMLDLLLSPQRFNVAAARYVDGLRANGASEAQYFGHILEITRLRRRVHPPKTVLRHVDSTRELRDGLQVNLLTGVDTIAGVIWAVNEDHLDVRLHRDSLPTVASTLWCQVPGVLGETHQFATTVRTIADVNRRIVRIEHSSELQMTANPAHDAGPAALSPSLKSVTRRHYAASKARHLRAHRARPST